MPKHLKAYRDKEKALRHRNKHRKKNYASTRLPDHKRPHDDIEMDLILHFAGTDRELSRKIRRSVQAIQVKRTRLKKNDMKLILEITGKDAANMIETIRDGLVDIAHNNPGNYFMELTHEDGTELRRVGSGMEEGKSG